MNVRNCRRCGKIFNYLCGEPICVNCKRELDETFKKVKEYIWDHKNCSVQEVVEKCEVEEKQIQRWIREERLEFVSGIGISCEKCGASISSGRFCNKCKLSMANELQHVSDQVHTQVKQKANTKESATKMRFLDR